MLSRAKKLTYEERIDRLDLWTLEERRNRADLLHQWRIQRGNCRGAEGRSAEGAEIRDAAGVEGVGNGEGVSPFPAD